MKFILLTIATIICASFALQSQTKDTVYVVQKDTVRLVKPKPKLGKINAEVGVVLVTPTYANALISLHHNDIFFKVTGAYLSQSYGIQFDLGLKAFVEDETYHAVSLAGGQVSNLSDEVTIGYRTYQEELLWTYMSVNYILNTKGFYLSVGTGYGRGDYSSPQLMLQIGYAYQFRD